MDYTQVFNWLTAIAAMSAMIAFALVVMQIGSWIADWFEGWWNKREYRKYNQAYPYDWNKQDWKEW